MSQQVFGQVKKGNVNVTTYVILALALGAMAFFGMCNPQGGRGGLSGNAGEVASEEIGNAEFVRAYQRYSEQLRRRFGDNFDAAREQVASRVLNQLIEQRILFLEAAKLGLTATDTEVVRYLAMQNAFMDENGAFSEEYFRRFLRSNRYSESGFQDEIRRSLTIDRLRDVLTQTAFVSSKAVEMDYVTSESRFNVEYLKVEESKLDASLSDEDLAAFKADEKSAGMIKAWYESHASDYKTEEAVHARHILIGHKEARNAVGAAADRSKEEAQAKAQEVLALVAAKPASFADLAKKHTDEPTGKESGGDLGFFNRDAMVASFSEAAFALKAGEHSAVVESPFGFHIIRVEERREAKETSLEDATDEIARKLLGNKVLPERASALASELLSVVKAGDEKTADALIKKNKLAWKKTGAFAPTARFVPGLGSAQALKDAVLALSDEQKLHPEVLTVGKVRYLVRLVSRERAQPDKLDDERRKQLASTGVFSAGLAFFTGFQERANASYESAIKRNAEYLALDTPRDDAI